MKHCTVLPIKDQRLCMLEVSKVVFVTFTQQYIQSNLTHVRGVKSVKCLKYCTINKRSKGMSEVSDV